MATSIELSTHEIHGLCQRYLTEDQPDTERNSELQQLQVLSYKLNSNSDVPAGFLGLHQFLLVEILLKNADDKEQRVERLCFFTKSAPMNIASRMEYLESFGVFKKEITVYREVLPHWQTLNAHVAPKCYYADNNLLVFENLGQQGYKMAAERNGLLSFKHLDCSLRTLAALHGGSIVHETKTGKPLSALYPHAIVENAYPHGISEQHARVQNFHNAIAVLKEFIKTMPRYQARLEHILAEFPKKMACIFELTKPSSKYQNVFTHGDLWANNIMFRYEGDDEATPLECRFVDFQLARYTAPMCDLVTLLTIPTSRQFRVQHFATLVNSYYGYLGEFLQQHGLALHDFLTQQQFLAGVEEFRIVGLVESCLFSHLTVLPPKLTQQLTSSTDGFSDFFDRKRIEICMTAFRADEIYRERLTDMIEDIVDGFILK